MHNQDKKLVLSIITVCKNDYIRLRKTIESTIPFYNDERFEHFVIDGGSSDSTPTFREYNSIFKNFNYISSPDGGIYQAMNKGIAHCRAPMVLFLNCGDTIVCDPDILCDTLSPHILETGTQTDIICMPTEEEGFKASRTVTPNRPKKYRMPTSHQGMIFSSDFLKREKYNEFYMIAADFDLYLRANNVYINRTNTHVLSRVECYGVASNNPLRSYSEYLTAVYCRLRGFDRISAMALILVRLGVVTGLKICLPRSWLWKIRGWRV